MYPQEGLRALGCLYEPHTEKRFSGRDFVP